MVGRWCSTPPTGRRWRTSTPGCSGWQVFDEADGGAAVAPSEDAGYNLAFQTEEHYVRPVWPAVRASR